jgi:formate dehydrogenase major subunit
MTNHWVDIKNADLVLIMGGNAAEAHPCGFKWVTEAKAHNKARLIVVDPRFTRSASVADVYVPIRTGTDIAFLGGVISYLITEDKIQHEYVTNYTDLSFIVREDFAFADGIYSGYDSNKHSYDKSTWDYEIGPDGYVKADPTLAHPRCVYQLLKQHYARYTPEMVERVCGTPKDKFLKVCEMIGSTSTTTRAMTVMYALGWTQHSVGSQMIRAGAMMQLLLGNIGVAGGGMNALRGHSNIQGLTDLGLMSNLLPGYMTLPGEKEQDYDKYIAARAFKPLRPNQLSYWQNYGKFFVSFMKAWWGDAATADNHWGYDYLPKLDKLYDMLQTFELMYQGKMSGYICQGFNPLAAAPNKAKMNDALAKLKFLVIMDPLATETSEFWRNFGEHNDVDPSKIRTEVFRLPTSCFAEEYGALTNSSRWLQWHWKGAEPPGRRAQRPADHGRAAGTAARDVPQRGRSVPRSDRESVLAVCGAEEPVTRGARERILGPGAQGSRRPEEPHTGHAQGRRAAGRVCRAARRWQHPLGLLDLLRRLGAYGQSDGAAGQLGPDRYRPDVGLGLGMACEPARAVQPRLLRSER